MKLFLLLLLNEGNEPIMSVTIEIRIIYSELTRNITNYTTLIINCFNYYCYYFIYTPDYIVI